MSKIQLPAIIILYTTSLNVIHVHAYLCRESVNSGLDYWNGLLDWTTGLTFDLKFSHEIGDFACMHVRLIATSHKDVICEEPGGLVQLGMCRLAT